MAGKRAVRERSFSMTVFEAITGASHSRFNLKATSTCVCGSPFFTVCSSVTVGAYDWLCTVVLNLPMRLHEELVFQ